MFYKLKKKLSPGGFAFSSLDLVNELSANISVQEQKRFFHRMGQGRI